MGAAAAPVMVLVIDDRAAAQRIYWDMGEGRQRQQVAKAHSHSTKQINNEIACQLDLDIPTQAHNSSHAV